MEKMRGVCTVVVLLVLLCLYLNLCQVADANPAETEALKNFMNAVDQRQILKSNWTGNDACNYDWIGVFCQKGAVYNLILESMGLTGSIPNNTISALASLRRISLKNNSLSGPLPDLSNSARSVLAVWLQENQFSGPIPAALFSNTRRLKKLFLSNNQLSGDIPVTLISVANLSNLHLEFNLLSGSLPPFNQASLKEFNVSFNQLTGPIPTTDVLPQFPVTSFTNNAGLCGQPLSIQCNGTPPGQGETPSTEPPEPALGPLPAFSPADIQSDVGVPAPWEPSGGSRVEGQRHGRRNAILTILVGVFLLL